MQTETGKTAEGTKKKVFVKELLDWGKSFAIALAIALLLRTFVFTMIRVDGDSMLNTLRDNDILFVTVFDRFIDDGYQRGDIVICYYPNAKGYRVKRVVGLPGETVEVKAGVTYINGEAQPELFVDNPARSDYGPYTVREGEFFLMGDNRAISKDSRNSAVGAIVADQIRGKARAIVFPFSRLGSPYEAGE